LSWPTQWLQGQPVLLEQLEQLEEEHQLLKTLLEVLAS
jgi:hypothetical protein